MEKWLDKYLEHFNDNFPLFTMMGTSDEEVVEIIKNCIANNKPMTIDENKVY